MTRRRFLGGSLGASAGIAALSGGTSRAALTLPEPATLVRIDCGDHPSLPGLGPASADLAKSLSGFDSGVAFAADTTDHESVHEPIVAATFRYTATIGDPADPRLLAGAVPYGLPPMTCLGWLFAHGGLDAIQAALRRTGRVSWPVAFGPPSHGLYVNAVPHRMADFREWRIAAPPAMHATIRRLGGTAIGYHEACAEATSPAHAFVSAGTVFDAAARLADRFHALLVPAWANGRDTVWLEFDAGDWERLGDATRRALSGACERALLRSIDSSPAVEADELAPVAARPRVLRWSRALADGLYAAARDALDGLAGQYPDTMSEPIASMTAALDWRSAAERLAAAARDTTAT